MRTKLIAFAAVASVLMASSALAEGGAGNMQHCKRPLITLGFAKQPTLVQSVPMPKKPL
jgi:hypothetical protein